MPGTQAKSSDQERHCRKSHGFGLSILGGELGNLGNGRAYFNGRFPRFGQMGARRGGMQSTTYPLPQSMPPTVIALLATGEMGGNAEILQSEIHGKSATHFRITANCLLSNSNRLIGLGEPAHIGKSRPARWE